MKKLSIEEKAKRYDEAIIRGSRLWESDAITRENYEYIFPELAESDDERVRKGIIKFLIDVNNGAYTKSELEIASWIAWLEKQGEQDNQVKFPTFTFDDILALQCCMETVKKVQEDKDLYEKLNELHSRVYDAYHLEKQGGDKKEINNFNVLPGLYKCVHRMFDGTPDGKLLFEVGNIYKCLSKHDRAEFEVSYGHSVYLEDPVVCKYFIPFEEQDEQKETLCDKCRKEQPSHSCQDITALERCAIEKQGESDIEEPNFFDDFRKTDSEVEPKFKVGDWINGYYTNYKVLLVNNDGYLVEDVDGNKMNILFENEKFHYLWTIQDAEDGDVLYLLDGNRPFIYKERNGYEQATAYCGLNIYGKFFVWGTKNCVITLSNYVPATKEQRDLLFQKMHEAGYEWDSEKKELKKIEQKPYGQMEKCINCQFNYTGYCNGTCILKNNKQKLTWSEEDEDAIGMAIIALEDMYDEDAPNTTYGGYNLPFNKAAERLKSLRPQNVWMSVDEEVYVKEPVLVQKKDKSDPFKGYIVCCDHTLVPNVHERYMILGNIVSQNSWKPSDEQINALDSTLQYSQVSHDSFEHLNSLFNDLKKLKGE